MKAHQFFFLLLFISVFEYGCKSTQGPAGLDKIGTAEGLDPAIPLSEHLRKLPGVSVLGSGQNTIITLKGFKSYSGKAEPLFVVDGSIFNGGYQAVATAIDVADIKSIRIIRDLVERQEYGLKGSNGVIEIKLKK